MTEPTQPVAQPHGATIEVLDRHAGEKRPYVGPGSIILPNHLRIDGVSVYATRDNPAVIREIRIDGTGLELFAVTVQLFARALRIGGTPAFDPAAAGGPLSESAAVIEIPDTDAMAPGDVLERPYVLLNGNPVYVHGGVGVGEMATAGDGQYAATVTMTLLCRKLLVDDEVTPPEEPAE